MLGALSVDEAYKSYAEAKRIFWKASMNLWEWMSNSSELINLLPRVEVATGCEIKPFEIVKLMFYR